MSKQELNRAYLNNKVNRIMEPMVKAILKELPEDPIPFMLKYISDNHGSRASIHKNERVELDTLR
jgi:hypothetical protein